MSVKSHVSVKMPDSLVALLPKARRRPVALSRNGKTAAFLVGARKYQDMQTVTKAYSRLEELTREEEDKAMAIADVVEANGAFLDNPPVCKLTNGIGDAMPKSGPLLLLHNGKTAAFLIRPRQYQKMRNASEFFVNYDGILTPEEERALLVQVKEARKEKPLSAEESRKFLDGMLNRLDKKLKCIEKQTATKITRRFKSVDCRL